MKVDSALVEGLGDVPDKARATEALGYDGLFTFEGPHDPFFPLVLAAEYTERIELSTAIAVAFARNPMLLANIGFDLQSTSQGRFVLGLGSQIRPHIQKRFSMPWSKPAARMREMVLAVRAIWDCWQEGADLDFEGEFYTHTLMTPFFNPGPNPFGLPRIAVAGVGPAMTRVAGEVADTFLVHPFTTERFLRDHTMPALEEGFARGGRSRDDFEISWPLFVVSGDTEEQRAASAVGARRQMAFYGSTPAYRPVLEAHGWGELQTELNAMSKQGQWAEMGDLIDDEILETVAVVGTPEDLPALICERYGDIIDRIALHAPGGVDDERWRAILEDFQKRG
ncbi:MAG: LLM class F420-dependent oxidoreductase [Acidimicrobiia bacterium]|nr:LLM class F420-dependent oxidoreductase [Acidimicrobiia bacterium]